MVRQYDLQYDDQNLKRLVDHMHDVPIEFYIRVLIFLILEEDVKQKHSLEIYNVPQDKNMKFQLLQIS